MPPILSIIASSWDFCKKQQAIAHAGFWFLFLPGVCTALLAEAEMRYKTIIEARPEIHMLLVALYIVVVLVFLWGTICILSIGKRLLQAKSGRARTSLLTVCQQSRHVFIPFILTSILRNVLTILWGLLLIIPGIVYYVRTVFFPIVLVCEGISYRAALKRSIQVTRGQFWSVLFSTLMLGILLILIPQFFSGIFAMMAKDAPWPIVLAAAVASSILLSLGIALYLLALIELYAWYKPARAAKPKIETLEAR